MVVAINTVCVPYPAIRTIMGTNATIGMDRMSRASGVSKPLMAGAAQDKQAIAKPNIKPKASPPDAVRAVWDASAAKNSASLTNANTTA